MVAGTHRPIVIALFPMATLALVGTVFRKHQSRSRLRVVLLKLQSRSRACMRAMARAVSVACPGLAENPVFPKCPRKKTTPCAYRRRLAPEIHTPYPMLGRRSPYFIPEARQRQRSPARRSRLNSRRPRCDACAVQSRAGHPFAACSRCDACERVASVALRACLSCTTPAIAHDRMPSLQVVRVASQSWSLALSAWLSKLPP